MTRVYRGLLTAAVGSLSLLLGPTGAAAGGDSLVKHVDVSNSKFSTSFRDEKYA